MHGMSIKYWNLTSGLEFLGVKRNAMARTYKPDPRGKKYLKHTPEAINSALADHRRGMSFPACSRKHGIPIAVLCCRARNPHMKPQRGQSVLSKDTEKFMAKKVASSATLNFPLDSTDIRYLFKGFLNKRGLVMSKFKSNMPSKDWVNSFVRRNQEIISHRICRNIKSTRASLSPSTVKDFISNIAQTLRDVSSSNIMSYDETNLQDDPGGEKESDIKTRHQIPRTSDGL